MESNFTSLKKFSIKQIVANIVITTLSLSGLYGLASPANAATPVGTTSNALVGVNAGLGVASINNSAAAAGVLVGSMTATASARSYGLVAKSANSSVGTGQTAQVALGGILSLYTVASTTIAFSATGGVMSATATGSTSNFPGTAPTTSTTAIAFTSAASGTAYIASVLYTAPETAGTYTITLNVAAAPGLSANTPTAINPLLGTTIGSIVVTVGGSHPAVGGTNAPDSLGAVNASMFVAVASNSGVTGAIHGMGNLIGDGESAALSKGLISKDTSFRTAQSATVFSGAVLSLYALVSTTTAITASAGSFSGSVGHSGVTATYSSSVNTTLFTGSTSTALDTVATLYTAPSTPGVYTVSLYTGNSTTQPTETDPAVTLGARITVTVVAASAGGSVSLPYSACNTATTSAAITAGAGTAGLDSTGRVADGGQWFIDFDLNDVYSADLAAGNVVASATNGALVSIGNAGSTPVIGSGSTAVSLRDGVSDTVRVDQPTAGAPVTTTVTISYNGVTVCTKTVTIRGAVDSLTIANVGTQKLNTSGGSAQWMYQEIGLYSAGLFTVLAKDSAGNIVATPSTLGTFSMDATTTTTTVIATSFPTLSSSSSSSDLTRFTLGSFYCSNIAAGQSNIKIKFTAAATGKITTSPAFVARCADDPYTYTASLDKASYTQGELATATVKFLDSKGNAANSVTAPGASTFVLPYMTGVSFTLPSASSTAVTKADGTVAYTFTVGNSTGLSAGTYTGIVEYSDLVAGVKSTPTYKLSTGSTDVTFTEVLKSVVALIASINKQIQALQKLILKR